jgi:hypothetical protein
MLLTYEFCLFYRIYFAFCWSAVQKPATNMLIKLQRTLPGSLYTTSSNTLFPILSGEVTSLPTPLYLHWITVVLNKQMEVNSEKLWNKAFLWHIFIRFLAKRLATLRYFITFLVPPGICSCLLNCTSSVNSSLANGTKLKNLPILTKKAYVGQCDSEGWSTAEDKSE